MESIEGMVSVIVPVYQAKKYLVNCIESILNQTYENIEIILVDDGSDDGSGELCDKYAAKYRKISCLHKENQGVSSARNLGLEYAKGEYILFIDSDDYIKVDYLEYALTAFKSTVDLYLCGYQEVRKEGKKQGREHYPAINDGEWQLTDIGNALMGLFRTSTLHAIGTKIYKRTIIERYGIRFKKRWKYYEDIYFCLSYLVHCNKIYVQNNIMYYYQKDIANSLSKKKENVSYESIYKTFFLLAKIMDLNEDEHGKQKIFYESYFIQVSLLIELRITAEKHFTLRMKQLYRQIAKDRMYKKSLEYAGKVEKAEYFCMQIGFYFGAYLIRKILVKIR